MLPDPVAVRTAPRARYMRLLSPHNTFVTVLVLESSNRLLPENNAAACFPRGFFDALGTQFPGTRLSKRVSIADASGGASDAAFSSPWPSLTLARFTAVRYAVHGLNSDRTSRR